MTRKRLDPRQILLGLDRDLAAAPMPVSFNWDAELRAALSEAVAQSGKSRADIAQEMERALGCDPHYPISVSTLDAWTAPSRTDWRFPLLYLPAFIEATGATWLLARVAAKSGHQVVTGEAAIGAELGAVMAQQEELREKERELRKRLRRGRI
ncbi:MAG: hypothetical protein ACK5XB_07265 [Rhodospirillales bacterium]|jgi:hypothetical protein